VRACIDISDGLVDDLSKLCKASGVAARVEAGRVPIHPLLREAFPERCLHLALGGGEDYQLLFTAPREVMERVLPQLEQPAALIGEVEAGEPGRVTVITPKGGRLTDIAGGWDHFR
jgi:thiamine-monophosphate kinase